MIPHLRLDKPAGTKGRQGVHVAGDNPVQEEQALIPMVYSA